MIRDITLSFFLILSPFLLSSQEEAMRVERASAINPDAPVYNIHVDQNGEKWVSNAEGLWQVHAADLASPVILGSVEESLLQFPNGNKDLRWLKGKLNEELGGIITGSNKISAAFYNEIQDHLWIGTTEAGVFLLRTQPQLKVIKEIHKRMPKLRSNKINMIYVDGNSDRHFMGTDEGVIVGRDGNWGLEERYFRFQAVANRGKEVWLLAEDLIWVINEKEQWRSLKIDPEQIRGVIKDIAFDREGKLWIASEYLTVFHVDSNKYRVFDGADYFTSSDVNCLAVDPEGAVWVGTQDKGLYVIEKESAMTVTCLVDNELSCDPLVDDASLIVKINGGQPPYTYQWDQGLSGENPKNLTVGTYTVTVTDSRGQSKPAAGVIPDSRLKLTVVQNRPHDEEKRGGATATVEGGKPKYTFLWDNGENGPSAERLEAGTHRVTVTDVNGCKAEASVEITRDAAILAAGIERVGVDKCAQSEVHALQLKISGGIEPYSVAWSDPAINGTEASGLKPGTYFATITDAAKTTTQASINLDKIELMKADASQRKAADPDGTKGSAMVNVSGHTGRLKYQWDNGESSAQAQDLAPGIHSVTVTDQNGCSTTATVEIAQEAATLVASIVRVGDDICAQSTVHSIELHISGGMEPYTIAWSDPAISGTTASDLQPGVYTGTVTDGAGNTVQSTINLSEIVVMQATASQLKAADLDGNGGSAMVEVTGSTGRLKYQWDNGESKARAQELTAGTHSITVTDQNGCNTNATVEITREIADLAVSIEPISKSKCAGDGQNSVQANVSGGIGPYIYQWNDQNLQGESISQLEGGVYALTVTDSRGESATASLNIETIKALEIETSVHADATANNSDGRASVRATGGTGDYSYSWSNGEKTREANLLTPGNHSVTVTDQAGCTSTAEVQITENISEMSVVLNLTKTLKCKDDNDATVETLVRGGKSPFAFTWSDTSLQGEKATGLGAGTYAITVSDAAGNIATASVDLIEPEPLTAEIIEERGVTDQASKDGWAQVKATGGTGEYTYLWDNGQTNDKAENLALGEHQVTVTDGNGCEVMVLLATKEKILPQLSLSKLRSGEVVQMQMLQFDADSTNLNETAEPILDEVYEFLKDNPGVVIRIEGHTNNVPPDEFCDKLSTARAKSVAEYIVQRGVAGERVYYRGYGKRQPIYSNLTPEGRRKNQRVEIKILNIGEDG